MVETFRCFDKDARGHLDPDELLAFLKLLQIKKEDKNGGMKDLEYEDIQDLISDACD